MTSVPTVPIWKLFHFADKIDGLLLFVGVISAIVHAAALPAMSLFLGDISNAINLEDAEYKVVEVVLKLVVLGVVALVSGFGQYATFSISAHRQTKKLKETYLAIMIKKDIAWFDSVKTGNLIERISGDTIIISEALGEKLGQLVQYVATFALSFGFGFYEGWKLSAVMLGVTPFLVASSAIAVVLIASYTSAVQTSYANAGAVASEVISAMKTIASLGIERNKIEEYSERVKKATRGGIKSSFIQGIGFGLSQMFLNISYAIALWYGGKLVTDQGYSGGDVIAIFFSVSFGAQSLGLAYPIIVQIGKAKGAAAVMFQTMKHEDKIGKSMNAGKKIEGLKGNITFEGVKFSYPFRPDIPVLNSLSLNIPSGKVTALVGPSGSGKSSIVGLVQRFYDAESGTVKIDEENIQSLDLTWWRQQIAIVSQEPSLFVGTIAENISHGKPGVSFDEIQRAAELSNAHGFISQFPEKYDTFVGEGGAQLSGGQKQRIAIARAILRDPKLLLLDEATSALDSESEKLVQQSLETLMKGRTTIVIAHRLSTIRNADQIAVIQKGSLLELGTHDELVANGGVYYDLVKLQGGMEDIPVASAPIINPHITQSIEKEKNAETGEKVEEKSKKVPFSRIAHLSKPEALWTILGVFFAVIDGAAIVGSSYLTSLLITVYYEPPDQLKRDIVKYAGAYGGIAGALLVTSIFEYGLFGYSGGKLTERLRVQTFRAILRQDMDFFDDPEHLPSLLTSNLAHDASTIQNLMGTKFGAQAKSVVIVLMSLILSFIAGWKLTLVNLAVTPVMALAQAMETLSYSSFAQSTKGDLANANQLAGESLANIRTIAAFTMEDIIIHKYHQLIEKPSKKTLRKSLIMGILYGIGEGAMYASFGLLFWYGYKLILKGEMTANDVLLVFVVMVNLGINIGTASAMAPDGKKAQAAAQTVFSIIDRVSKADPLSEEGLNVDIEGEIELKELDFAYPCNFIYLCNQLARPNVKIFRGINLKIKKGKVVALVGPSGGGKSSIVGLIERFYHPLSGSLLIDEKPIEAYNVSKLREKIGLVGQEPKLFSGTISENIACGKPGTTQEEIERCCKIANAHDFITKLPDGYNTMLGERGASLSGGQKQRIAIARAIIKDPKILLLDEATSALDSESEKVVQEGLEQAMKGRTTIIIAHRLSTIQNADEIVVIWKGKVVEQGTHSELMELQGIYRSLVDKQRH